MSNWTEEIMKKHIETLHSTWLEYYHDITINQCNVRVENEMISRIITEILQSNDEDERNYLIERKQSLEKRVVKNQTHMDKIFMEYKLWFRKLSPIDLKIVVAKANQFNAALN